MCTARKSVLLIVMVIAAVAFTASNALAKGGISIVSEATGTACTGGCAVHAVGTATLYTDFGFEFAEATCVTELDMSIDEAGNSSTGDMELSPGDANCNNTSTAVVTDCNLPWTGSGEEVAPGRVHFTVSLCVKATESGSTCSGSIEYDMVVSGSEDKEHYDLTFNHVHITNSVCELDVDMEYEGRTSSGDSDIHINHL